MTKKYQKQTTIFEQMELMQRILDVRYSDLEEERRLCTVLLKISEDEQYLYGCAFAYIYLLDSHLALGEYGSCDFYLMRASLLCHDHNFDDLTLVLYNSAGLYYQKFNDDPMAVSYFLDGVPLAKKLHNTDMIVKLYNNIGYSFVRNGDLASAKQYFEMAYEIIETHSADYSVRTVVSCLSNLAEIYKCLNDAEKCLQAICHCEQLCGDDTLNRIRLASSWHSYYTMLKDQNQCAKIADQILDSNLLNTEDQFFLCDVAESFCDNSLSMEDYPRARRFLDIVLKMEYSTSLALRHRMQCLKIRCWERFGEDELLVQAYQEYYEIAKKTAAIEDEILAQSIVSKIHIQQSTLERKSMRQEMQALEKTSQLDDLTGLYNRRYFNKMLHKIILRNDADTLGFIMLDVDCFKQYNDFYGHFEGDTALRTVSKILTNHTIKGIYVSRYGGDEFVCVCVNLPDKEIENYIRKISAELLNEHVPHAKNPNGKFLTVSIGYCNEPYRAGADTQVLLDLADKALYTVKEKDRGTYMRLRLDQPSLSVSENTQAK